MILLTGRLTPFFVGCAVFFAALLVLAIGLSAPAELYFDETWYVPAARSLLTTGEMLRQEHPPLGKLLIALSMAMFGDNPIGWRALSCGAGALVLAGLYAWTLAMTRSIAWGLYAAALGLLGGVIYVQARIAMLDIFLMAFGVWAIVFFSLSLSENVSKRTALAWLFATGAFLGLASACKLSGAFLWAGLAFIALMIATLRRWGARMETPSAQDFFAEGRWRGLSLAQGLVAFVAFPLAAYSATYAQQMLHAGSWSEIFASHARMREIMSGDAGTHPYSSNWWQWPALIRPVWYYFKIPGGDAQTWSAATPAVGVVALASPVLTALGELAILFALERWMLSRDLGSLLVATSFFSQYLPWIINPKGLEFSFYFFPSLLAVGPALAIAFARIDSSLIRRSLAGLVLLVGLASFLFFLPVLSAAIGNVSPEQFERRIWLASWR